MAGGGGLSRFGAEWALYVLELLGVSVMYTGFIKSEEVIKQKDEPNKTLSIKILLYANKHKGDPRDLMKLSRHLKIGSPEGFISALEQLENEKFLVSDPRIWSLTTKGETAASVIENSRKNHLRLLLLCVALCVVLVLTIVVKNLL